jgi:hypothetical protein
MNLTTKISLAILALSPAVASAQVPITLYNTGVAGPNAPNGSNTPIVGANPVPDPNYTVISTPNFITPPYPQAWTVLPSPPNGAYFADPNSNWDNDLNSNNAEPGAVYVYQTTFDLTGLLPSTATVSGTVYCDNYLFGIEINGASTGIAGNPSLPGFMAGNGVNFTISSGFIPGINTLDFQIYNDNGGNSQGTATGFDVTDLRGTADTVPEPASTGLFMASGIGMLARRRRMKN